MDLKAWLRVLKYQAILICFLSAVLCTAKTRFVLRNATDATFRLGFKGGPIYSSIGGSLYPYWVGSVPDYSWRLMLQVRISCFPY